MYLQTQEQFDLQKIDLPARILALEKAADEFWIIFVGSLVLFMQLGVAFIEGGAVRFKNMQSIMIKVFIDTAIAIIMTWIVGYGLMMGKNDSNKVIGIDLFAAEGFDKDTRHYAIFIIQSTVAAAANSILSGGAAERMSIWGFMILSVVFSSWIFPVAMHWGYGNGWLMDMGYHDFSGSGTIHVTCAIGVLTTTVMLKPRKYRFDPKHAQEFEPCNITYITLATLSLYSLWMFFNAGSSFALSGNSIYFMTTAAMSTMLSGAAGGLTVFVLYYLMHKQEKNRYSLLMICCGNLAGLVAVSASCDNIEPWAAIIIGFLAGFVYIGVGKLLIYFHIDDPVDALPIHGGCGFLGALMPGFFLRDNGVFYGNSGRQLGVQCLGIICYIGWSFIWHFITNAFLKWFGLFRVNEFIEQYGFDNTITGGRAFIFETIGQNECELCNHDDQEDYGNYQKNQIQMSQEIQLVGHLGTNTSDSNGGHRKIDHYLNSEQHDTIIDNQEGHGYHRPIVQGGHNKGFQGDPGQRAMGHHLPGGQGGQGGSDNSSGHNIHGYNGKQGGQRHNSNGH